VTVIAGNGSDYDPSTGATKGNGGFGGTINTMTIAAGANDVLLMSGAGGGGSVVGRPGGNIGFVHVTNANAVTFLAGAGGGFTDPMSPDKENTDVGGAGGSILNNRVGGGAGDLITGNVTFLAGSGYGNALDVTSGGPGGAIDSAVIVTTGDIVLTAGNGGEADDDDPDNTNLNRGGGGLGGLVRIAELSGMNITVSGGTGGAGTDGGRGGLVEDLELIVNGEANLFAGNGGAATGASARDGGDGADLSEINVAGAGFVRAMAAGDGGNSAAGDRGDGGSITRIAFPGGVIGDFASAYGMAGMGGLFAGDGANRGGITDVLAAMISNIVAHNSANPALANPAHSISGITATGVGEAIGSDLDNDGAFDFNDSGPVNGAYDFATETPIDGLVLAEALGTITGSTLFTLATGTGQSTGTVDPN